MALAMILMLTSGVPLFLWGAIKLLDDYLSRPRIRVDRRYMEEEGGAPMRVCRHCGAREK